MATQTSLAVPTEVSAQPKRSASQRYLALDAYRGFIMFVLVSGGFGLAALARRNPAYAGIASQFDHMDWEWIHFWDLIQPAFMFMVGVAMPFALASRMAQGADRTGALPARGGAQSPAHSVEPGPDVDLAAALCTSSSSTCWRRSASPISFAT